jgi:DNA-binding MarR family transcriptional regulator
MPDQHVRLTTSTLAVLDVIRNAAIAGEFVWGFKICDQASLGPGTVYPILDRLERMGWLVGSWETCKEPRRRFYEMTAAGRVELAAAIASRPRLGRRWGHLLRQGGAA